MMLATIVSMFVKFGLGSIVEKTIQLMEHRAQMETDKEKLRTELAAEHLKAMVEETRLMTDFNKKKLDSPVMWLFLALYLVPLGMWWTAVCFDSIFLFGWGVADAPVLREWGGQMIQWLFYVGGGIAAFKAVVK